MMVTEHLAHPFDRIDRVWPGFSLSYHASVLRVTGLSMMAVA